MDKILRENCKCRVFLHLGTRMVVWIFVLLFSIHPHIAYSQFKDDPIPPPLSADDSSKTIVVNLKFKNGKVSGHSVDVVFGNSPARIGNPPLLRMELFDFEEKFLEEFNAWHPQWRFEQTDTGRERLVIDLDAEGSVLFPFSSEYARLNVIDVEQEDVDQDGELISIDLVPTIRDFCINNAVDPDCEDIGRLGLLACDPNTPGAIIGTQGNDRLFGTPRDDVIIGLGGNDSIAGRGGNDCISGGPGNDNILSGAGDDEIDGGSGDDRIDAGSGANKIIGGADNDTIRTGGGNDEIVGGLGNDNILSGAGDDEIDGGSGDDRIDAGEGANKIIGGAGNDTIRTGGGIDEIAGGLGNDNIVSGDGDDEIDGGLGTDRIIGGSGSDTCVNGEIVGSCNP